MSSESVYDIIKHDDGNSLRGGGGIGGKPSYQSIRKGVDIPPTYSNFGIHGTSVIVGNAGGYVNTDVPCVHPAKKAFGTFGRFVADTIDSNTFLKMSGNRGVQPPAKGGVGSSNINNSIPEGTTPTGGDEGDGGNKVGAFEGNNSSSGLQQGLNASAKRKFVRQEVVEKRAPTFKHNDKPPLNGLQSNKNFTTANAVEATLLVPKRLPPQPLRAVDLPKFAAVPEYLVKRKEEINEYKTAIADGIARRKKEAEVFYRMSLNEIMDLRTALKKRWDALNKEYQTMGFSIDTFSRMKKQQELEVELRTIEKALDKIKRDVIFIFDEDKPLPDY